MNLLAALFIISISIYKDTLQAIIINTMWLFISLIGLFNVHIRIRTLPVFVWLFIGILFTLIPIISIIFFQNKVVYDILAWFSVYVFVGSYFLFTAEQISEKIFHIFNFLAALTIIPKMLMFGNYQVVFLEIIWALFAFIGYRKSL